MNPEYPVYIITRGRWRDQERLTGRVFDKLGVPYYMVVDGDEYEKYAEVMDPEKILIIPPKYYEEYDTGDDLGDLKPKGPGYKRNFTWDHSLSLGAERHWVFDDNIRTFYRMNNNKSTPVGDGTIFKIMEDFVNRYENVALAGPNYWKFTPKTGRRPPFILNRRVFSMFLIKNDIPYRWKNRYNEDVDMSLRVLKDGWCTVLFNAFVGDKATTQTMKGGCNDEFYSKEGTHNKSRWAVIMHPDVAKVKWKFNRWHHEVDYSLFKGNKLIRKKGVEIPTGTNNYGMELEYVGPTHKKKDNS